MSTIRFKLAFIHCILTHHIIVEFLIIKQQNKQIKQNERRYLYLNNNNNDIIRTVPKAPVLPNSNSTLLGCG